MQKISIPLFDCRIMLATGAIDLALFNRAPLLPVFTVRNEAGEYEVTIERPLNLAVGGDRGASVEAAKQDYTTRLAPYALEYVGQFDLTPRSIVQPRDG
jgi:lauroyl/myristoyl acyltransferase